MIADGPNSQLLANVYLPDGRIDREAAVALLHEDVVWDMSRSPFPDARVYRGITGALEWFDGLANAFGDVTYEVQRVREVGDQVAQLLRVGGRGPGSGIPVDYSFVPVMRFREGKIVHMDRYDDWAQAMAAMERSP